MTYDARGNVASTKTCRGAGGTDCRTEYSDLSRAMLRGRALDPRWDKLAAIPRRPLGERDRQHLQARAEPDGQRRRGARDEPDGGMTDLHLHRWRRRSGRTASRCRQGC